MNSNLFTECLYFYVITGAVIKYLCRYWESLYLFTVWYTEHLILNVFRLVYMIDTFKTA